MASLSENTARRLSRLRKKAFSALSDWRGPLRHPQDLLDFEKFAEAEQIATHQLEAQQNVESGRAWQR